MNNLTRKIKKNIKSFMKKMTGVRELEQKVDVLFKYITGLSFDAGERVYVASWTEAKNKHPDHYIRYEFASKFVEKNDKILDLACGCGYGSAMISDKANPKEIIAGDICEKTIEFAKRIFWDKGVDYRVIDARNSDNFSESSFDKVISFETIEHLPIGMEKVIVKNFYNWLKPKAKIICSVPNENILPFNNDRTTEFHYQHFTPESFTALLKEAGFNNVKLYYFDKNYQNVSESLPNNPHETIIAIAEK